MIRPVFTELALFATPFVLYALYLWATRDEDCWESIAWLASLGILAAPGSFYGAAGRRHVRVALTATDERVQTAALRLTNAR